MGGQPPGKNDIILLRGGRYPLDLLPVEAVGHHLHPTCTQALQVPGRSPGYCQVAVGQPGSDKFSDPAHLSLPSQVLLPVVTPDLMPGNKELLGPTVSLLIPSAR